MTTTSQSIQAALVCPNCQRIEQVQHVPAVYQSGHGSYSGNSSMVGVAGGHVAYGYGVHYGTTVNNAARSLTPVPALRSGGWLLVAGLFFLPVLALGVWVAVNMTRHGNPTLTTGVQKGSYAAGTWFMPVFFAMPPVLNGSAGAR